MIFIDRQSHKTTRNIIRSKGFGAIVKTPKNPFFLLQNSNQKMMNRNDKCQCGSGRKYKYCCLNMSNNIRFMPKIDYKSIHGKWLKRCSYSCQKLETFLYHYKNWLEPIIKRIILNNYNFTSIASEIIRTSYEHSSLFPAFTRELGILIVDEGKNNKVNGTYSTSKSESKRYKLNLDAFELVDEVKPKEKDFFLSKKSRSEWTIERQIKNKEKRIRKKKNEQKEYAFKQRRIKKEREEELKKELGLRYEYNEIYQLNKAIKLIQIKNRKYEKHELSEESKEQIERIKKEVAEVKKNEKEKTEKQLNKEWNTLLKKWKKWDNQDVIYLLQRVIILKELAKIFKGKLVVLFHSKILTTYLQIKLVLLLQYLIINSKFYFSGFI